MKIEDLKKKLINKEIEYGGIIKNVPRIKISPFDPRSKEELDMGGIGGDRMLHHGYAQEYAKHLHKYLDKKHLTVVEIGILTGIGLSIWSDVFKNVQVYGFDIDLDYYQKNLSNLKKLGAFKRNTPSVFEFDQFKNNTKLLNTLFNNNKIDICTDDGHHSNEANLNTFKQILPFLSPDFVYFIEDNVTVYQKIKEKYPQFKVESFGELTIITNPKEEIREYINNKQNRRADTVIYTTITNKYDSLNQPLHISHNIDYVCFTNSKIKNPGIWTIKPLSDINTDPVRESRYHKLFPHLLLPEYKYSIYIDSNIQILSNILEKRIKHLIRKKSIISIHPHPLRNCVYQEAKACIDLQKDNPSIILKEVKFLKRQAYPKNNGLHENNIIFREHNNSKIIKLMEDWWWMIKNFSRRDQLSFDYVLWKNKIICTPLFPQNARSMTDDFVYKDHNKKIISTLFINQGNGFNDDGFIQKQVVISGNNYYASFPLNEFKTCSSFKFNPVKGQFCQYKLNKIKINNKVYPVEKIKLETNGKLLENGFIDFSRISDPILIFNIKNTSVNKLKLFGNVNFYNTENLYIESTNQINNLIQEKEQIKIESTNQINNLIQEKEKIQKDLNKIQTSKTYKLWQKFNKIKRLILSPYNFLKYFIRSIIFYTNYEFNKIFIKKTELKYIEDKFIIDGVSFIIPTWNNEEMVVSCVKNLINIVSKECRDLDKEIIIVDNGSKDQTVKSLEKLKSEVPIKIIKLKTNLGFGQAVNLAAKKSKYNYIYLLNNDMFPNNGFLTEIIEFAQNLIKNKKPFFGLSSQIFFYDPTKRREESGKTYITPKFGFINVAHSVNEANLIDNSITAYPGGGSSLLNKYVFEEIDFYDYKSYKPLYCEDLDSGFVAWKIGFPSYYIANSHVIHHHRSSSKQLSVDPDFIMHKNWLTFILKNISDRSLYLNHIFSYSLLCALDKKYREYSNDVYKNIDSILNSKLELTKFNNKYEEKELINFVEFETKHDF